MPKIREVIKLNTIDYTLTLDTNQIEPFDYINKKLSSTKGDPLVLLINLTINGSPYNLTDLSITAGLIKPSRDKFTVDQGEYLQVLDAINGQIKLILTDDLIDTVGRTLLQIQLKDSINNQMTFKAMLYFINRINPNEVTI